jgi:hypothetical protein
MDEQFILNFLRPEVGVEYRAESQEADLTDRFLVALGLLQDRDDLFRRKLLALHQTPPFW